MKTQRSHFYLPLFLILLSGCASLGVAPAQTFNQKVAYAIGVHSAVLQATTNAVTNGQMSSADASAVLTQADNANVFLQAAVAANVSGDATTATNKLTLATAALTALQTYLNAHGSKTP